MYEDRGSVQTQKIFCDICQATGGKFVLKNIQELTLHLRMHNMPEKSALYLNPYSPLSYPLYIVTTVPPDARSSPARCLSRQCAPGEQAP